MAAEDVQRLLDLISFLRRHENTTEEEIASLLGCSREEVQALLDRILMCGTPPYSPRDYVCVFRDEGRVRVQFAEHFRRPVKFTPAQAACLMVLLDDPMVGENEQVRQVRERIKAKLAEASASDAEGEGEPPIAISRPGSHVQRIAAALQEAIRRQCRVELVHFSSTRFARVRREVDPHRLLRIGDQVYLVGFDHTHRHKILRFRLDRIEQVLPLDTPAAEPNEQELQHALGADVQPREQDYGPNSPAETLLLRVGPQLAPVVRETYEASRVKMQPDGSALLRLPLLTDHWVLRFVLAYGDEAEILEPARMRTKLSVLVDQLLDNL